MRLITDVVSFFQPDPNSRSITRWPNAQWSQEKAGFTLIELLLVVAVISILSTLVLVAINPSQRIAASLDAQRKSDLAQLHDSLNAYAAAHSGGYPSTGGEFWCDDCGLYDIADERGPNDWIPQLVDQGYIKQLPHDPQNGLATAGNCVENASYGYVYISDGTDYKLMAFCTATTDLNSDASQTAGSSSYCPTVPPVDDTSFTQAPTGVSELRPLVDPRRPLTGYAFYSQGYTCK